MTKRTVKKSGARGKTGKNRSPKRTSSPNGKLSNETVTLIVLLKAREGQELLLEAELRALVGPTRREGGCIRYDLHRGADAAASYLLHEVWASREAHRAHTQTAHFIRWDARKDGVLASRDVTFWRQVV
jgi:quinol monooxygenase YgiN